MAGAPPAGLPLAGVGRSLGDSRARRCGSQSHAFRVRLGLGPGFSPLFAFTFLIHCGMTIFVKYNKNYLKTGPGKEIETVSPSIIRVNRHTVTV